MRTHPPLGSHGSCTRAILLPWMLAIVLVVPTRAQADEPDPEQSTTTAADTSGSGSAKLASAARAAADDPATGDDEGIAVWVKGIGEFGTLGVLTHTYQNGSSGTLFDYKRDGGQGVLFPYARLSAELTLDEAHTFVLLYQPLQLNTEAVLRKPIVVDAQTFPAGTPMELRYGFDFYRFSYLYDTWWDEPETNLEIGLTLQIRNAVVDFTSADGALGRSFQNMGLVPALKVRGRHEFSSGVWVAADMDVMYAPIRYLNGGDSDVEGAILDTSISLGYEVARSLGIFVCVREIAGGAEGTSKDEEDYGDGFTLNWLAFLTGSIGVEWTPTDLL